MKRFDLTYRPSWNLMLITVGSVLFAIGVQAIVIHHKFITGGIYGAALFIYYKNGLLSPGIWFFLLNAPLFMVSWFFVSRRFFFYSLYGVIVVSVASEIIRIDFGIQDQLYAAIAGGLICGAGSGMVLRSLGSGGGVDIIAVLLNEKFNFGIGKTYMLFNAVLFAFFITSFGPDLFIASLVLVFITSTAVEYVLAMFNKRKIIYVISDQNHEISRVLRDDLNQGATFIKARGVYSQQDKLILMTVTNWIQLKRIEQLVFTIDPNALFIVENTFNVIGASFNRRKIY
jgi:uncharacterized membrane-anchored protein YitT (DUF2179 family)